MLRKYLGKKSVCVVTRLRSRRYRAHPGKDKIFSSFFQNLQTVPGAPPSLKFYFIFSPLARFNEYRRSFPQGLNCWGVRLTINPLNAELNPICYLLALLGAHHFLHVSRIRVKSLTLRLLMSYIYIYIYGAPILDVSRSHTTTHHSR